MKTHIHFSLFLAFIAISLIVNAQPVSIPLSGKHISKIERIKSPQKKLEKYRKYYTKDSLKLFRQADKFIKRWSDSVEHASSSLKSKGAELRQGVSDKRERVAKRLGGEVRERTSALVIRERDYRLPAELDKKYTTTQLQTLYGVMRTYLAYSMSDSLSLTKFGLHMPSMANPHLEKVTQQISGNLPNIRNPVQALKSKASAARTELKNAKSLRLIAKEQKRMAAYEKQAKAYKTIYGSLPKSKEDVFEFGESKLVTLASRQKEMRELESLKKQYSAAKPWDEYKAKGEQLQDSAYVKEQARKKAEELAMKYLQENPALVQSAQKKMALLMKKYSVVPNSNDLSTAVKRSSLHGMPLKQRLYLAGNFQVVSVEPFSIDFAPAVGYKFNRYFIVGAGGTYREAFSKHKTTLSPDVLGYKGFVSYDVLQSFFIYGEYANNSPGMVKKETESYREWRQALIAGVGRKFSIHPKFQMICLVTYNFFHEPNDPVYPQPLIVRVGVQLSELAMLKRQ